MSTLSFEDGSNSAFTEAFRSLRTNLLFAMPNRPSRVIEITSVGQAEGKSSVAANLARLFAMAGSSCILVDADLRRPVQAANFEISGRVGLTNVLLGSIELQDALCETQTTGMWLLPSGPRPPNPAELLGSEAMEEVLEQLRSLAEVIIIDTPPLLPVTDAAVLAPRVDGTVLVVSSGSTNRQAALSAKQSLERVQARILGVVVNRVVTESRYYHNYYTK